MVYGPIRREREENANFLRRIQGEESKNARRQREASAKRMAHRLLHRHYIAAFEAWSTFAMKRVKAKKLFLRIVSPLKQEVLRGWRDHVRALHGERDAALKRAAAKMMNRALAMTFSNWALFTDNVRSVRAMLRRNLAGKNLRIFLRWSEWAVQRAQARREVHAKGVLLDRGLERLRLRAVTYMQKVFRAYRQRVHAAALVVGARHARAREEETHRRAAEDTFVHDAVKGAMDGCAARLCHTRAGRRRVRSEMQRQWRASKGLPPKKKKKMAAKDGDAYNVGEESDSMLEIDATVAGAMHSVHVERELGGVEWPKGWLKKLVHRVRRRLAPSVRTIRALNTLLHEEALGAAAKDVVLFRRDRPPLFVCGGFDGGYGCREAFAVQADLDERSKQFHARQYAADAVSGAAGLGSSGKQLTPARRRGSVEGTPIRTPGRSGLLLPAPGREQHERAAPLGRDFWIELKGAVYGVSHIETQLYVDEQQRAILADTVNDVIEFQSSDTGGHQAKTLLGRLDSVSFSATNVRVFGITASDSLLRLPVFPPGSRAVRNRTEFCGFHQT